MILTKLSHLVILTIILGMMTTGFVSAEILPVENIGGGKGYYDISSNPEGGTVIFDGKNKGITPVTVEVSTSGTPGHTISISKEGYRTWSSNQPGNPFEGETISINADLLFIPVTEPTTLPPTTIIGGGKGYYDISSNPEGGTVIFDGKNKGITPVTVEVSTSGTPGHTISISKEGYRTWSSNQPGNPFEGETVHVDADLVFIPITLPPTPIGGEKGYYYVMSSPSGAAVSLDGTNQGTTPINLEVSSTGTPGHTIGVAMPGYQSWSQYYPGNPPAGSTVTVNAVLSPMYQNGNIQVMSSPSGAYAVLDNGQNSMVTPGTFSSVSAGWHNVRVTKTGYYPYSQDVQVNAGGTRLGVSQPCPDLTTGEYINQLNPERGGYLRRHNLPGRNEPDCRQSCNRIPYRNPQKSRVPDLVFAVFCIFRSDYVCNRPARTGLEPVHRGPPCSFVPLGCGSIC